MSFIIKTGLHDLAEHYRQKPTDKQIHMYYESLRHYDDQAVIKVLSTAADRFKWFPALSELVSLVNATSKAPKKKNRCMACHNTGYTFTTGPDNYIISFNGKSVIYEWAAKCRRCG